MIQITKECVNLFYEKDSLMNNPSGNIFWFAHTAVLSHKKIERYHE